MTTAHPGLPTVAVAVKSVPVGGAFLRVVEGGLTRDGLSHGLDPINEVAVEWAVRAREAGTVGRVVAVSMGPLGAGDAVRRALAMGCDDVMQIDDAALAGAGVGTTARVLAAAVDRLGAAVAVFGYESLDGSSGAVPAAVAAVLGRPLLSFARTAAVDDGAVRIERDAGRGREVLAADLPVVVSLVAGGVEPRFPTLRDMLGARKATLIPVDLAGLGAVLPAAGGERVVGVVSVPVAAGEPVVVDEAGGVDALLELLVARGVVDA